jgi:hypothetical protein
MWRYGTLIAWRLRWTISKSDSVGFKKAIESFLRSNVQAPDDVENGLILTYQWFRVLTSEMIQRLEDSSTTVLGMPLKRMIIVLQIKLGIFPLCFLDKIETQRQIFRQEQEHLDRYGVGKKTIPQHPPLLLSLFDYVTKRANLKIPVVYRHTGRVMNRILCLGKLIDLARK